MSFCVVNADNNDDNVHSGGGSVYLNESKNIPTTQQSYSIRSKSPTMKILHQ